MRRSSSTDDSGSVFFNLKGCWLIRVSGARAAIKDSHSTRPIRTQEH
jgi:hypothetical protein